MLILHIPHSSFHIEKNLSDSRLTIGENFSFRIQSEDIILQPFFLKQELLYRVQELQLQLLQQAL